MRYLVYRLGDCYSLEPQEEAEPITIECDPNIRLEISGSKQLLAYRDHEPFGRSLDWAVQAGWCRVAEPPPQR